MFFASFYNIRLQQNYYLVYKEIKIMGHCVEPNFHLTLLQFKLIVIFIVTVETVVIGARNKSVNSVQLCVCLVPGTTTETTTET